MYSFTEKDSIKIAKDVNNAEIDRINRQIASLSSKLKDLKIKDFELEIRDTAYDATEFYILTTRDINLDYLRNMYDISINVEDVVLTYVVTTWCDLSNADEYSFTVYSLDHHEVCDQLEDIVSLDSKIVYDDNCRILGPTEDDLDMDEYDFDKDDICSPAREEVKRDVKLYHIIKNNV